MAKRTVTAARKKVAKKAVRKKVAKKPAAALVKAPKRPPMPTHQVEALPATMSLASMGLSQSRFTPDERARLMQAFTDDEYEIKPSGEVYVSHIFIRGRLNHIFGPGDWALMPEDPVEKNGSVIQKWTLMVRGRPVAAAYGEARYIASNKRHSWGKALESAKSNALMRCAKDLGVASSCWNRRWQYNYRLRQGVFVNVRDRMGKLEGAWRHVESPPLHNEVGIRDDSPNQDRYLAPTAARKQAAGAVWRPPTEDDERAVQAAEQRAQASQAAVPYGDAPIGNQARKAIFGALKTHGRTEAAFKDYLRDTWNYTSTNQILQSQLAAALDWIRSPAAYVPGEDEPIDIEGEVVE